MLEKEQELVKQESSRVATLRKQLDDLYNRENAMIDAHKYISTRIITNN